MAINRFYSESHWAEFRNQTIRKAELTTEKEKICFEVVQSSANETRREELAFFKALKREGTRGLLKDNKKSSEITTFNSKESGIFAENLKSKEESQRNATKT